MTDSDPDAVSQVEIAKGFLLPERQAKVNQLISKMDHDGDEIYCICRSSDCSRFMIGCDRCNEWYHGDCINLTQEESVHIKHFYCHLCRGKDPNLKIKYKHKKKKDKDKERSSHKDKIKKHRSEKHSDKNRDHDRHRHSEKSSKHSDKPRHSEKHRDQVRKHEPGKKEALVKNRDIVKKPKPKEPEKPKDVPQTSETRPEKPQLPEPEPLSRPPEPTPPVAETPMELTESDAEGLDDVDLEKPKTAQEVAQDMLPGNHSMTSRSAAAKKSARRCGQCVSCSRTEDCGRCDFCKDMKKFGGPNRIRQKCRLRQCLNFGLLKMQKLKALTESGVESENDEFDENYSRSAKSPRRDRRQSGEFTSPGRKRGRDKTKKTDKRTKKGPKKSPGRPRIKRHMEEVFEEVLMKVEEDKSPRQCLGPGCIEVAREGSKYCSDDCGMKLATNRIFEILPQRIRQWQASGCISEENNKKSLEQIRQQQLQARQKLVELDLKHQELDALLVRAKHIIADPEQENTDGDDEGEMSIHCVTCGHEISQRTAVRHMERCFTKFESQTSFGSIYKTRIEGNSMFCDFYNSHAKTYCKRLKVLCPEHSKEPKVSPEEVCGCPLMSNIFEDTKELCRTNKRKCNKHYCWEKLRRAEIDMERVRQWMKLDDLFEQERHIRVAMSSRAGVLGLMLHQTLDHDPLKPMKSKS